MRKTKFLVDEDLPPAIVQVLQIRGYEAEHVTAIGLRGKPDNAIFTAAQEHEAILLSADLGFSNISNHPLGTHFGIIVLRFPDYFRRPDIVELIDQFLQTVNPNTLKGALTIVTPGSVRIRRHR